MPTGHCQYCRSSFDDFPTHCPVCRQELRMVTAIDYLGQCLFEHLSSGDSLPADKKKKLTLYLKFCQKFICDSELALLNVKLARDDFDEPTLKAIEDVIQSHRQHADNLKTALKIIGLSPPEDLGEVVKKTLSTQKRLEKLMQSWLGEDAAGGRSIIRAPGNRPDNSA